VPEFANPIDATASHFCDARPEIWDRGPRTYADTPDHSSSVRIPQPSPSGPPQPALQRPGRGRVETTVKPFFVSPSPAPGDWVDDVHRRLTLNGVGKWVCAAPFRGLNTDGAFHARSGGFRDVQESTTHSQHDAPSRWLGRQRKGRPLPRGFGDGDEVLPSVGNRRLRRTRSTCHPTTLPTASVGGGT